METMANERGTEPDEEALDAYSRVVTSVAERLIPSVVSLRVRGQVRGGSAGGSFQLQHEPAQMARAMARGSPAMSLSASVGVTSATGAGER